jgi:hypothetical protein
MVTDLVYGLAMQLSNGLITGPNVPPTRVNYKLYIPDIWHAVISQNLRRIQLMPYFDLVSVESDVPDNFT